MIYDPFEFKRIGLKVLMSANGVWHLLCLAMGKTVGIFFRQNLLHISCLFLYVKLISHFV